MPHTTFEDWTTAVKGMHKKVRLQRIRLKILICHMGPRRRFFSPPEPNALCIAVVLRCISALAVAFFVWALDIFSCMFNQPINTSLTR